MRRLLPRTSAAALLLSAALLVSSTGGAVAGSLITGAQIKNNSVTGKDIKDGSLASTDLAPDTRAVLTGPAGPAGPKGATGAAGQTGQTGQTGQPGQTGQAPSLGYQIVVSNSPVVVAGAHTSAAASCPAGKKVVGAGGQWLNSDVAVQIYPSVSGTSATTWYAEGINTSGGNDYFYLSIVCVTA